MTNRGQPRNVMAKKLDSLRGSDVRKAAVANLMYVAR